ncbi:hypothetical protein ACH5RR_005401 [Cinchona calisaya]|uniref:glutathione transferase n=1 Tax=Cinchona calisaya TaxID=153742 RepID=A0ABD3AL39_9GENT
MIFFNHFMHRMVNKKMISSCSPLFYRFVQEVRPPVLNSTSEPPPIFDGNSRLYVCYICPFAQRAWITRNVKGLQDKIQLVAIDLGDRPAWYKEKVYPENKVPSLEHNGRVTGESLDLIKYIDENFEGPTLLPDDREKRKFAEELIAYSETFLKTVYTSFKAEDPVKEAGVAFDYLETALQKFDKGPFLLGQAISLADISYAPFIERYLGFFEHQWKYDITSGRPKLAAWVEEINKIDAYKQTKCDINKIIQLYKSRFLGQK